MSRSAAGQSLAAVTGSSGRGLVYATVAEALASAQVDVLVDYTSAAAVRNNVWAAVEAGVHVVVGSSGLTAGDYQELDRLARDRGVGVIAAGNFSVMAAVLRRAAAMAARHLDQWEIIDYASDDKPDVPSGTAAELAETLAQVRTPGLTVGLSDLHGPVEARGADVAGTRIHSVRLPSFVVTTEVVFGGPGRAADHAPRSGADSRPLTCPGPCWPSATWPAWWACAEDWTRCCSGSLPPTLAGSARAVTPTGRAGSRRRAAG